jgi:hypothetical protein
VSGIYFLFKQFGASPASVLVGLWLAGIYFPSKQFSDSPIHVQAFHFPKPFVQSVPVDVQGIRCGNGFPVVKQVTVGGLCQVGFFLLVIFHQEPGIRKDHGIIFVKLDDPVKEQEDRKVRDLENAVGVPERLGSGSGMLEALG